MIRDTKNICPDCNEDEMDDEYFWKHGKRKEKTGDRVCSGCGYRESSQFLVE